MSKAKPNQPGLIHIYTGDGKGKTTAALGLALRAAGQGFNVIVIQFLKGDRDCGEHHFAERYQPFEIVQFTEGNCFVLPEDELRNDVRQAMAYAEEVITSGKHEMVVLDEIFVAINRRLLDTSQVVELLRKKPDPLELVLTGRHAPSEIIELADLVTEMHAIKHPYRSHGITARRGIEY